MGVLCSHLAASRDCLHGWPWEPLALLIWPGAFLFREMLSAALSPNPHNRLGETTIWHTPTVRLRRAEPWEGGSALTAEAGRTYSARQRA